MIAWDDISAKGVALDDHLPLNIYKGATKIAGWHPQTVSGEGTISLDGAYNVPPDALVIDGKCVQDTTTGKNKMPVPPAGTQVVNGITVVSDGLGKLTISGTASGGSANISFYFSAPVTLSDVTYFAHLRNSAAYGNVAIDFSGTTVSPVISSINRILETDVLRNKVLTYIKVYVANGAVISTPITVEPSIELTGDITTYEPYTGGIPSPNPDYPQPITPITGDLTITGTGKNLLDLTYASLQYVNSVYYYRYSGTLTLQAGVSYTLSTSDGSIANGLYFKKKSDNSILSAAYGKNKLTYTPTVTVDVWIDGYWAGGRNGAVLQLELGSTATTYEPYMGDTVVTPLGSVELCSLPDGTKDTYDAVTGVVTKRVGKYVGASGTSWEITAAATNASFISDKITAGNLSGQTLTALSTCAPIVYYKLATPTTIQLTPDLPVVRTGIKSLSVSANITPSLTATVKAMD